MENMGDKSAERNFMQLLRAKWGEGKFVCVGLDSQYTKIPEKLVREEWWKSRLTEAGDCLFAFNRKIVDATHNVVCAYKLNSAFYEPEQAGWEAIRRTIQYINDVAPGVPVIWDAKRGDIGNTNNGYIRAQDKTGADAITVNGYVGREAMKPFLDRPNKGVIVLCRTSNEGAEEFQNLRVLWDPHEGMPGNLSHDAESIPLYQVVAHQMYNWNYNGNVGVVAGATNPEDVREIREIIGEDMPILIPGVGAQGGDLEAAVLAGINNKGAGIIVNSSRGIIFASGGSDFAEVARAETLKLHEAIRRCLTTKQEGGLSDGN